MNRQIKTYSELVSFSTFNERFLYLKLEGVPGVETFGSKRWLNQVLYHSSEWRSFKNDMIIRDLGCDLAIRGNEIRGPVYLHHLNPICVEDILDRRPNVMDPENVVCVGLGTHNAIHYGNAELVVLQNTERKPNDTCPWRI